MAPDGKPFHIIYFNGRFLSVCEYNRPWRDERVINLSVEVFDKLELVDFNIESKDLWRRSVEYSHGTYSEHIIAVSNTTSLIVHHNTTVSILNYWKDRIIKSKRSKLETLGFE